MLCNFVLVIRHQTLSFCWKSIFPPKKITSESKFRYQLLSLHIVTSPPPQKKKLIITHYGMFGGILFQLCSRIDLKNSIRLQMRI